MARDKVPENLIDVVNTVYDLEIETGSDEDKARDKAADERRRELYRKKKSEDPPFDDDLPF